MASFALNSLKYDLRCMRLLLDLVAHDLTKPLNQVTGPQRVVFLSIDTACVHRFRKGVFSLLGGVAAAREQQRWKSNSALKKTLVTYNQIYFIYNYNKFTVLYYFSR